MKEMNEVFFLAIDETSGMFTCYEHSTSSKVVNLFWKLRIMGSNLFF